MPDRAKFQRVGQATQRARQFVEHAACRAPGELRIKRNHQEAAATLGMAFLDDASDRRITVAHCIANRERFYRVAVTFSQQAPEQQGLTFSVKFEWRPVASPDRFVALC